MTNTALQNHRHEQIPSFDTLEPRLMLSATSTEIAQAMSLPFGTDITYVGNPAAVSVRNVRTQAGLPGFLTSNDDSVLILSTGDASWFDTKTKQQAGRGTDFGNDGLPDTASVTFNINVPVSSDHRPQKLRFTCMMLSQEYDEWIGSDFNDGFTATVTSEVSAPQVFESINTSDIDFAQHLDVSGTYFDGRTKMLDATFDIPTGAASLTITFSIADATDGLFDSAVVIDNLRIVKQELVYLDFNGGSVGNLFGYGTTTVLPAFTASDVRSSDATSTVIGQIVAAVANKFQDYDIEFTTTQPSGWPYTTIIIGGSSSTPTHLDPIIQNLKSLPPNTTLGSYFGDTLPLGMADAEDLNNVQDDNLCTVLSGEFTSYGVQAIGDLAVTICHELGHALGLRDVTGDNDIMDAGLFDSFEVSGGNTNTYPIASESFGSSDLPPAQTWLDGQTTQNDDNYLSGILGSPDADSELMSTKRPTAINITSAVKIYNVTIGVYSPSMSDVAPAYVHLDSLVGTQQVNLPIDSDDAQVFLFAASKSGGPIDIVSGTPTAPPAQPAPAPANGVTPPAPTKIVGSLTLDATRLDAVSGGNVTVPNILTSKLRRDGRFEQPLLSKAVAKATITMVNSAFFSNDTVGWMAPKKGTYIDSDGDIYTVSLSGPGLVSVYMDDPDGNGHGPISQILLENTTAASKLKITVRQAGGDGLVQVEEIIGANLGSISAPAVDIAGRGIHLSGMLGSLTMHDMDSGSAIYIGGAKTKVANITLQTIGDNAIISSQSTIGKFTAYNVGTADIDAPAVGTMTVRNNFAASVTIGEQVGVATTLKKVSILGNASNSQWHIFSGQVGTVTVAGDADDMLFYTSAGIAKMTFASLVGSQIYAGLPDPSAFTSTVATSNGLLPNDPAQFYPAQIKSLTIGTMADSCIAAGTMGTVSIRSITTDNSGRAFGLATGALSRLNMPAPAKPLRNLTDVSQSLNADDFVVQIV
jgi:hypothetical protein